jgi:hypothetical protein
MDTKVGIHTVGLAAALALAGCAATSRSPGEALTDPRGARGVAGWLQPSTRLVAAERIAAGDARQQQGVDAYAVCGSCHEGAHSSLRTEPPEVPPSAREVALADVPSFGAIGLLVAVSAADPNAPAAPWGTHSADDAGSGEGDRLFGDTIVDPLSLGGLGFGVEARPAASAMTRLDPCSRSGRGPGGPRPGT